MAHVIVVDDSRDNNRILTRLLQRGDHTSETFTDAYEALQYMTENHVDLVITDLMMPNMDGIAFTCAIRQELERVDLPILMLTASTASKDRYASFEAGVNAYLTKPLNVADVLETLEQLLAVAPADEVW